MMISEFQTGDLHPNTPHLFADLAELILLTGHLGRKFLTESDLASVLNANQISSDELDLEDEESQTDSCSAERNSRQDRQIEEVFAHLSYRSQAFGDWYPFCFAGDVLSLRELSEQRRIYIFLLACSRLRSFGRGGLPQRWAKNFACISKYAMQALMPVTATTRIFDANSIDRQSYYGTDLRKALRVLGKDLGVLWINEDECDKVSSSGDAGFDIISTLEFGDGAAIHHAIVAQCGAQEVGWPKKTFEAHSSRFAGFFQLQYQPPSVMFTPVCFRTTNGGWVDNHAINSILLVDRWRIMCLITSDPSYLHGLIAENWFVEFEMEWNSSFPAPIN